MEDNQILELYWKRSENAVTQTAKKYGKYCNAIAFNILHNNEDSEECVNDTYLKAWNSIPPQRPQKFSAFLGKITRNLSLNKYRSYTSAKRGAGQMTVALEELADCIPAPDSVEQATDEIMLVDILNQFLSSLSSDCRKIFMRRYWYFCSIKEIARDFGMSESKVKMSLFRSRNSLKEYLEKEGVYL